MKLPDYINYIGVFLTMNCNYNCSYCLNWRSNYQEVDGNCWVESLNRLETKVPVTLQGGEPTLYSNFYTVIEGLIHKVHLLTNLSFDVEEFVHRLTPDKFDNMKTFAPIRVSFHSGKTDEKKLVKKIHILEDCGFRVGLYFIETTENMQAYHKIKKAFPSLDLQTKPLLDCSVINNTMAERQIMCRTRELLVSPEGVVYKCHRDLYKKQDPINILQHINDSDFSFRECCHSKECHPCDIKTKRDRFGCGGYCAVEKK